LESFYGNIATILHSQTEIWSKSIDFTGLSESSSSLDIDKDSNIIVVGTIRFSNGKTGCGVVKLNQNGDTLWTKNISSLANGISGTYGFKAIDILVDNLDSNYIVLINKGLSTTSSWSATSLIKLDENGNILWMTAENYNFYARSFFQDSDNNLILCGVMLGGGGQTFDFAVKKWNNSGVEIWSFQMQGTGGFNGTDDDYALNAVEDENGNYYVVGVENETNYLDATFHQDANSSIFKLSHDGTLVSYKNYNFSGSEALIDLEIGYDGNLICVGFTNTVGGLFVTKIDSSNLDTLVYNELFTIDWNYCDMVRGFDILRTNIDSTFVIVGYGPTSPSKGPFRSLLVDNNCNLTCNNSQFSLESQTELKSVLFGDKIISVGMGDAVNEIQNFYITKYEYSSICNGGCMVSVKEMEKSNISLAIYPNPANTQVTINIDNFGLMNGYKIRIDNSIAQVVFETPIEQQEYLIDLSEWTGNGTYFIYILDDQNNIVEVRKIILQ
jgi:hypothetical protein